MWQPCQKKDAGSWPCCGPCSFQCVTLSARSYLGIVAGSRHRIQDSLWLLTGLVHERGTKAHQAGSEKQISERVDEEDVAIETVDVPAENKHLACFHLHTCPLRQHFVFFSWAGEALWAHLLLRPLVGLLYQPRIIYEYRAFGGTRIGMGNWGTQRKPAPVPFCPPQIPYDLNWDWNRAAAVGSRRLIAWATAWSFWHHCCISRSFKLHKFIFLNINGYNSFHLHSSLYIKSHPFTTIPAPGLF
jgi:hypothetical protein